MGLARRMSLDSLDSLDTLRIEGPKHVFILVPVDERTLGYELTRTLKLVDQIV